MTYASVSRRDVLRWAGGLALALPGLSLVSHGKGASERRLTTLTGFTMGTTYSVKIVDLPERVKPRVKPEVLHAGMARILKTIHDQMSTYQADSELSRFNASTSTSWMAISSDTLAVIDEALRISQRYDGAFDVTVGPLVNLWGFGPPGRQVLLPSDRQIQAAMDRVGYTGIQTRASPPAVKKHRPDIYVDLSAIAKGYGIDRLGAYLESFDLHHYLVEIGGELRGRGHNAQGEPWEIGIEQPLRSRPAIQRIVRLHDGVVATSGHYQNYFETRGRRYTHIIHPRTGEPCAQDLAAVSVIGQSTMSADALATALMVLGPEAGFRIAVREQLAALFVVKDGKTFTERHTPAFEPYAA